MGAVALVLASGAVLGAVLWIRNRVRTPMESCLRETGDARMCANEKQSDPEGFDLKYGYRVR
jgi:uncharacterized membrane protein YeiB